MGNLTGRFLFVCSFRHGKMYFYPGEQFDEESFVKFVEEGFKLAVNEPVPHPLSLL